MAAAVAVPVRSSNGSTSTWGVSGALDLTDVHDHANTDAPAAIMAASTAGSRNAIHRTGEWVVV